MNKFNVKGMIKLSLAKFEIFNTVVELGSLTKAGEALGLTQSAVSHAISSLESEWGFSILNRGRSGINLTSNGEHVLKYIREMLKWNEEMHSRNREYQWIGNRYSTYWNFFKCIGSMVTSES